MTFDVLEMSLWMISGMFAVAALMTGNALERRMEDLLDKNSTELHDSQGLDNTELAVPLMATLTFTVGFVMVTVYRILIHNYNVSVIQVDRNRIY